MSPMSRLHNECRRRCPMSPMSLRMQMRGCLAAIAVVALLATALFLQLSCRAEEKKPDDKNKEDFTIEFSFVSPDGKRLKPTEVWVEFPANGGIKVLKANDDGIFTVHIPATNVSKSLVIFCRAAGILSVHQTLNGGKSISGLELVHDPEQIKKLKLLQVANLLETYKALVMQVLMSDKLGDDREFYKTILEPKSS